MANTHQTPSSINGRCVVCDDRGLTSGICTHCNRPRVTRLPDLIDLRPNLYDERRDYEIVGPGLTTRQETTA